MGRPIEPFIPRAAFNSHPTLKRELDLGDQGDLDAIWKLPGGVRARDANWLPGRLFHSRLAPISRFAVRGGDLVSGRIELWRPRRSPRLSAQDASLGQRLASGPGKRDTARLLCATPRKRCRRGLWPYLREQQRLANDLPHTGMVVTIDIDGAGIHPANKIDVGQRLARWALANDYGKQIAFSGPLFQRQKIQDGKIVLHFRHAESGLMVAAKKGLADPRETPDAELAHFEVTDKTGQWQPAKAKIEGKTVVVTSPKVASPIAVRYAYAVTPDNCNLYNRDGLPASPFCSRPDMLVYDPMLPQ